MLSQAFGPLALIDLLIACACRLLESLIESGCDPLEDCGALLQAAKPTTATVTASITNQRTAFIQDLTLGPSPQAQANG